MFVLAIGSVKGFAFTLGLTTVIDVLVVFMFTKPLMTLLARTKFFGGGHRLVGSRSRLTSAYRRCPGRDPATRRSPRCGGSSEEGV